MEKKICDRILHDSMKNVLKNTKNCTAISAFVIDGKKIESKCIGDIITINSLNVAIEKANQYLLPYLKYAVETRATGVVFLVNTDVIVGCIYQIWGSENSRTSGTLYKVVSRGSNILWMQGLFNKEIHLSGKSHPCLIIL